MVWALEPAQAPLALALTLQVWVLQQALAVAAQSAWEQEQLVSARQPVPEMAQALAPQAWAVAAQSAWEQEPALPGAA